MFSLGRIWYLSTSYSINLHSMKEVRSDMYIFIVDFLSMIAISILAFFFNKYVNGLKLISLYCSVALPQPHAPRSSRGSLKRPQYSVNPRLTANIFHILSYAWLSNLIKKGFKYVAIS